jgi:hypothetical protein
VGPVERFVDVWFGSLADMAACANNVGFTPKSGHPNKLEIDLTQFVFIRSAPLTNPHYSPPTIAT